MNKRLDYPLVSLLGTQGDDSHQLRNLMQLTQMNMKAFRVKKKNKKKKKYAKSCYKFFE